MIIEFPGKNKNKNTKDSTVNNFCGLEFIPDKEHNSEHYDYYKIAINKVIFTRHALNKKENNPDYWMGMLSGINVLSQLFECLFFEGVRVVESMDADGNPIAGKKYTIGFSEEKNKGEKDD